MTYGFIGTGNMATPLIKVTNTCVNKGNIYLSNRTVSKAEKIAKEFSNNLSTNKEIAEKCKYIIIGVKPYFVQDVFDEIGDILKKRNDYILVTMVAGLKFEDYYKMLGFKCPIIRLAPNTPVEVMDGVILYTSNLVKNEDANEYMDTLKNGGLLMEIDEDHLDIAGTLAGCGPAYVDMIAEAIADAGVYMGLKRSDALMLGCKMLSGSANLIMKSGKHPIQLKGEVTSPGGTTIVGVKVLQEAGVPSAIMNAFIAAYEKNKQLRNK